MNELVRRLRAEQPTIVRATREEILAAGGPLTELLPAAEIDAGIAATNRRVLDHMVGDGGRDDALHVELGAFAAAAGVGLEEVTAGYRIGAQLAWAAMERHLRELDVGADVALDLAALHVAYVDRLAADSRRGYARAAQAAESARGVERQALVELLLAPAPPAPDALTTACRAAAWGVEQENGSQSRSLGSPPEVAVAVALQPLAELPAAALAGRAGGALVLIVSDPGALDALPVACGPLVPVARARDSLLGAERLAALVRGGTLAAQPLRWEEHLPLLLAQADPLAAAALRARVLEPLAGVPAAHAALLRETLRAWLRHPGRPTAIAAELHLHPQSARYRIARLRERFGAVLDDPDARLELQLALLSA